MDPLPFARALALVKRQQDALRQVQPGRQVRDRDADPDRSLPRQAGDRHEAPQALRDLVHARPVAIGAGLAEARYRAIDDARIDGPHGLVIDAEPVFHAGAVVLDDDIGVLRHRQEYLAALVGLEVQRHRPLVAMEVLEVEAMALAGHHRSRILSGRRLDLDHIGAPVGELAHGRRPRAGTSEVEDLDMGERQRGGHGGSGFRSGEKRASFKHGRHRPCQPAECLLSAPSMAHKQGNSVMVA